MNKVRRGEERISGNMVTSFRLTHGASLSIHIVYLSKGIVTMVNVLFYFLAKNTFFFAHYNCAKEQNIAIKNW